MTTWRHTETVTLPGGPTCRGCFADARHCTTPTPDPASPCAMCGDPEGGRWHAEYVEGDQWHDHVPTRCTCGHAIEPAR